MFCIFFPLFDKFFISPDVEVVEKQKVAVTKTDSVKVDSTKKEKLNDAGIRKPGLVFNPGFEQLYEMAKTNNIPFFIYLHPEISEIELGHFNDQGDEIITFAKEKDIRLINEFQFKILPKYYRKMDVVHYNSSGQVFLADNLYPLFQEYLNLKK